MYERPRKTYEKKSGNPRGTLDIVNAVDWSDMLVYIIGDDFTNDIGAKNHVKYKALSHYNGNGDGYFTNDAAALRGAEDKDMVTNPLFSFVNWTGYYKGLDAGEIPMYKVGDDGKVEFAGDNGLWLVAIGNNITGNTLNVNAKQPTFNNIYNGTWKYYADLNDKYRKAKALFMLSLRRTWRSWISRSRFTCGNMPNRISLRRSITSATARPWKCY